MSKLAEFVVHLSIWFLHSNTSVAGTNSFSTKLLSCKVFLACDMYWYAVSLLPPILSINSSGNATANCKTDSIPACINFFLVAGPIPSKSSNRISAMLWEIVWSPQVREFFAF